MSELTSNSKPFDSSSSSAGGFSFDHVHRNALLQHQIAATTNNHNTAASSSSSTILPLATKTGTTIVGLVYSNGIVLGADTRATNDTTVADKNCDKIHYIAPNIYCCGAGTAADTEKTTELIASQMELLRLNTGNGAEHSRVVTACTLLKRLLFRYQGHISAALVLGGCDPIDGPALYQIYPHGSTSKLPYTTMGSGSLAAMAIFESDYRDDLTEDEAVALVRRSILAGIFNDLGSGSNVDTCIIRTDGSVTMGRNDIMPNEVGPLRDMVKRSDVLNIGRGTTPILKSTFVKSKGGMMMGGGVSLADVTVTAMET
jgi:20S proteasome subunit beta 2